jgi:hypothetical protein
MTKKSKKNPKKNLNFLHLQVSFFIIIFAIILKTEKYKI